MYCCEHDFIYTMNSRGNPLQTSHWISWFQFGGRTANYIQRERTYAPVEFRNTTIWCSRRFFERYNYFAHVNRGTLRPARCWQISGSKRIPTNFEKEYYVNVWWHKELKEQRMQIRLQSTNATSVVNLLSADKFNSKNTTAWSCHETSMW